MAEHNELGRTGELIAKNYLEDKGYFIRDCNWKSGHYELDIVAEHNNTLVIVEVKTRSNTEHGLPREAVTQQKQEKLRKTALFYLSANEMEVPVRFDVAEVYTDKKHNPFSMHIEYLENAF